MWSTPKESFVMIETIEFKNEWKLTYSLTEGVQLVRKIWNINTICNNAQLKRKSFVRLVVFDGRPSQLNNYPYFMHKFIALSRQWWRRLCAFRWWKWYWDSHSICLVISLLFHFSLNRIFRWVINTLWLYKCSIQRNDEGKRECHFLLCESCSRIPLTYNFIYYLK